MPVRRLATPSASMRPKWLQGGRDGVLEEGSADGALDGGLDADADALGAVRDEDREVVTEHAPVGLAGRRVGAARFPRDVEVGDSGEVLEGPGDVGVGEAEVAVEDARRGGRVPGRERDDPGPRRERERDGRGPRRGQAAGNPVELPGGP
jgi:hypothetical protein